MERTWKEDSAVLNFKTDYCVIERLLGWLEKEDAEIERVVGYGFCLAAVTYFFARLSQSLF